MAFIKINRQNFFHNLNQIALQIGSDKYIAIEKIAIVLKDNAYGHGLETMAKLASEYGIKHAVVKDTNEAKRVESYFEKILVLSDNIIKHESFSYAINSLSGIQKAQKGAKVELKVDTGMHRNGIAMDELEIAIEQIKKQGLELVGVMTHFRSADELSSELFWQQKNFENVKKRVKALGFHNINFHSHNSATILRSMSFDEDLVRVGIAAYGYSELEDIFDKHNLRPVLSLHANRVSTRKLKKGERVGYGGDFIAPKEMVVSTYDLGYGDGWCRGNSVKPYITAENLPILGRVSMDFITLEGDKDEVCIMSDAQCAGEQQNTISYEIFTSLHERLERVVV
jgi:alanine racemase